ncbi:MAG: hypothetical protein ACSW8I_05910 [bacterium]
MNGIVLFADNKVFSKGNENKLFNLFLQKKDFSVLPIDNLSCLESTIKSASTFKACIIDWNFENEENEDEDFVGVKHPQRTPMSILQEYPLYTLVYIYSEKSISDSEKSLLNEKYGNKIHFRIKGSNVENEYQTISKDINNFETKNTHMSIPYLWSQSINQSTQTIFRELESADPYWIKEIRDTAIADGGDATSEVIGIFHNLLSEDIIQNEILRKGLDEYSSDNVISEEVNTAKLYQRIFYSRLIDQAPIMTGDIFHFLDDTWGILITPECEVRNRLMNSKALDFLSFKITDTNDYLIKKCTFDRIKSAYNTFRDGKKDKIKKIFNNEDLSTHVLPSFPYEDDVYNQLIVIDFKNAYTTVKETEYKNNRTSYKLNSPYIHQLRQRYISFFGKYGVPAIPDSLRDFNLK